MSESRRLEPIRVLMLGGWSSGPLDWLRSEFGDVCEFHEPNIPTPPMGFQWCLSPSMVLLIVWFSGLPGLILPSLDDLPTLLHVLLNLCVLLAVVVWTVRHSIEKGLRIAQIMIHERQIDLIVGFSWGGGLGCWLLSRGCNVPTMLLAPTYAVMARFALMRVPQPMFSAGNEVAIFHATHDGFCPASQRAALELTGAEMHTCNDVHVFANFRSLEAISACYLRLLQLVGSRRNFNAGQESDRGDSPK